MKERPIIFSTEMVKAILEGRKTMTRRVMKPQPKHIVEAVKKEWVDYPQSIGHSFIVDRGYWEGNGLLNRFVECPYGQVGDRLWVRETLYRNPYFDEAGYVADNSAVMVSNTIGEMLKWRWQKDTLSSMFMPREASRILLEIAGIRVERLKEITEEDAIAEGFEYPTNWGSGSSFRYTFQILWDSLNAKKYPWVSNPWCWCISFKVIDK